MIYFLFKYLVLFATGTQFSQNCIDAFFIDYTHTFSRYTKSNKTLFALNPETVRVQVRQETAFSRVQCVGTVITGHRTLASNLADSGHVYSPKIKLARASYRELAPRQATSLVPGGFTM